jgi:hypothetical protein
VSRLSQLEEFLTIALPQLWNHWTIQAKDSDLTYSRTYEILPYSFSLVIHGFRQHSGQLTAFYQGTPIWSMVFTGHVLDKEESDADVILKFLTHTIASHNSPFGRPQEHADGPICYKSSSIGSLEDFEGRDWIEIGQTVVYRGTYSGGVVR